jgi:CheY-like chemotaxis protein
VPALILIIEDNEDNMTLMDYLLAAGGYTPLLATSGAQGVRIATQHEPDLILLDIQMPQMDGYEVAGAMRRTPALASVSIVAVTAFAMVGDQERIIAAGFEGYLTKPITPETFVHDVEQFLPRQLWASADAAIGAPR